MKTVKTKALMSMNYSNDGYTVKSAKAGDVFDLNEDVFNDLMEHTKHIIEKFVEEDDVEVEDDVASTLSDEELDEYMYINYDEDISSLSRADKIKAIRKVEE